MSGISQNLEVLRISYRLVQSALRTSHQTDSQLPSSRKHKAVQACLPFALSRCSLLKSAHAACSTTSLPLEDQDGHPLLQTPSLPSLRLWCCWVASLGTRSDFLSSCAQLSSSDTACELLIACLLRIPTSKSTSSFSTLPTTCAASAEAMIPLRLSEACEWLRAPAATNTASIEHRECRSRSLSATDGAEATDSPVCKRRLRHGFLTGLQVGL
jgi:hypothetical protein